MITIGEFTIKLLKNGKGWIETQDGEGTEFYLEELVDVLREWFGAVM